MFNVQGEIKGETLTLTIDLSQAARAAAQVSKSGKTRLLALTQSFVRFGDVAVSLNATIKLDQQEHAPIGASPPLRILTK